MDETKRIWVEKATNGESKERLVQISQGAKKDRFAKPGENESKVLEQMFETD